MTADAQVLPLAFRPAGAAAYLGVSRSYIYEMIADGRLVGRKLGGATLVARDDLDRLFQSADFAPATKRAQHTHRNGGAFCTTTNGAP